jgi:hypothetical protein
VKSEEIGGGRVADMLWPGGAASQQGRWAWPRPCRPAVIWRDAGRQSASLALKVVF